MSDIRVWWKILRFLAEHRPDGETAGGLTFFALNSRPGAAARDAVLADLARAGLVTAALSPVQCGTNGTRDVLVYRLTDAGRETAASLESSAALARR